MQSKFVNMWMFRKQRSKEPPNLCINIFLIYLSIPQSVSCPRLENLSAEEETLQKFKTKRYGKLWGCQHVHNFPSCQRGLCYTHLQSCWFARRLGKTFLRDLIHSVLVWPFVHLEDSLPSTEGGRGYKVSVMVMFKWETSNVLHQQMGIYRPDEFHREN